jgi:hypothetical protein
MHSIATQSHTAAPSGGARYHTAKRARSSQHAPATNHVGKKIDKKHTGLPCYPLLAGRQAAPARPPLALCPRKVGYTCWRRHIRGPLGSWSASMRRRCAGQRVGLPGRVHIGPHRTRWRGPRPRLPGERGGWKREASPGGDVPLLNLEKFSASRRWERLCKCKSARRACASARAAGRKRTAQNARIRASRQVGVEGAVQATGPVSGLRKWLTACYRL